MGRGIDIRPVLSHPLFLVSFLANIAGWFSAFIGQAVTEGKFHDQGGHGSGVGVPWFGIFLQAFLNIGFFRALATDSLVSARLQLSTFLGIAVVFAVLGVNTGIFTSTSYQLAIGAGWLIIAIVDIFWLLFLTSEEDSFFVHLFNTGASTHFSPTRGTTGGGGRSSSHRGPVSGISNQSGVSGGGLGYTHNNGSSNAYAGVGKSGMGPAGMSVGELSQGHEDMLAAGGGGGGNGSLGGQNQRSPTIAGQSMMSQGPEYALKAKALYSYSASPDDPNEISFTKGDLLDIVDNSGKWWQARKQDGTKGIVPSNYVTML